MTFSQKVAQDMRAFGKPVNPLQFVALMLFSSGFLAVFCYRVYAPLWRWGRVFRLMGKIIERISQILTGCYIEPQADIAGGFHLPHGIGVVIGGGVVIHENVTLYQHVTLGRKNTKNKAVPSIGAGSVLYTGAVVVGGVSLPPNSIVGAYEIRASAQKKSRKTGAS